LKERQRRKKISCVLDTSATMTMIPWEIAYALGYDPHLSKEKIGVITGSRTKYAPLITLQSLSCLGMKKCNYLQLFTTFHQEVMWMDY